MATDPKDHIIFMNPAARSLTGWNIGDKPDKSGKPLKGEIELICRDGTKRLIEECRAPNMDEKGNIIGSVIIFRDITERRKIEEIHLENKLLMYANKLKSEFLAIMSHDIRTPLTSILGFSQLLKQKKTGELNAKQEHYVDNILSSGKFLLDLINDILDLSKIEAEKMELDIDQMCLEKSITEIFGILREQAEKHNITMINNIEPGLDFIRADERRFKQVLFNLLSNALKFSKEDGGVIKL
ncbi:MAG: two component system histidine kinase, partial [Candidatus Methanoperedens nitroreducens]